MWEGVSFWLGKLSTCTFISGCVSVFTPETDRNFAKVAQQTHIQTCPLGIYGQQPSLPLAPTWVSGVVPHEEVAGKDFQFQASLEAYRIVSFTALPLPPISGSRDLLGVPHPAGRGTGGSPSSPAAFRVFHWRECEARGISFSRAPAGPPPRGVGSPVLLEPQTSGPCKSLSMGAVVWVACLTF